MPDDSPNEVAETQETSTAVQQETVEETDVAALKAELVQAKGQAHQAAILQEHVGTLFNGSATEGQRAEALQAVMVAGGINSGDAIQLLSQMNDAQQATGDENVAVETPADTGEGQQLVDQIMGRINTLEQAAVNKRKTDAEDAQAMAQVQLNQAVEDSFTNDKAMTTYMETMTRARGEKHAIKVKGFLAQDVKRDTMERLYARKAKVGFFDKSWIAEESSKAVAATLDKARSLGVTDGIGKTPGGADEMAMYAELAEQKLEPPKYDPKKSMSDMNREVTEWTKKRFQQIAARAATTPGDASKA